MKKMISSLLVLLIVTGIMASSASSGEPDKIPLIPTASSVYSNSVYYHPLNTVDGDYNTFWIGGYAEAPWWIKFDAEEIKDIGKINIIWYSSYYIPTNYDIQISTDGETWEDVYTGLAGVFERDGEEKEINREARYIRLYIHSVNGNVYCVLREFTAFKNIDIPRTIRFQGILRDSEGSLLEGEEFKLTFRLYDKETEGALLWEETQTLSIEGGILDAELGSEQPLDLPFDRQYWLSIEVETDGEMTPRFKLTTVPYAIRSDE